VIKKASSNNIIELLKDLNQEDMKEIKWWVPSIGEKEYEYIRSVLNNNYPNEGTLTTSFENKLSELLGVKHTIAVPNGTSALYLSLKALEVGQGDEVIVPDITFIATANATNMCGAKPIFVDIDKKTMNMAPDCFEKAITKRTKAVIPVHVSGRAADIQNISKIAKEHNIFIIEDAAEGFYSKHNGKCLGTFGKMGCFSFSAHKTITTGQGGAIVTDDDKLNITLRELKDQGRLTRGTGGDDLHDVIGYNFKYTDLQAAVGLGQLEYLKSRIERMKRNYLLYSEELEKVEEVHLFKFDIKGGEIPQWIDAAIENRDKFDSYLRSKDIDCRRFWFPIHTQKPYKLPDNDFPNSIEMAAKSLWLPSAYTMTDYEIQYVCSHIKKFFKSEQNPD